MTSLEGSPLLEATSRLHLSKDLFQELNGFDLRYERGELDAGAERGEQGDGGAVQDDEVAGRS